MLRVRLFDSFPKIFMILLILAETESSVDLETTSLNVFNLQAALEGAFVLYDLNAFPFV